MMAGHLLTPNLRDLDLDGIYYNFAQHFTDYHTKYGKTSPICNVVFQLSQLNCAKNYQT